MEYEGCGVCPALYLDLQKGLGGIGEKDARCVVWMMPALELPFRRQRDGLVDEWDAKQKFRGKLDPFAFFSLFSNPCHLHVPEEIPPPSFNYSADAVVLGDTCGR